MAGVDEGKRQTSGEDARPNPSKTPGAECSAQPKPVKPSKVAQLFPKNRMLKSMLAPNTTESSEVTKEKRRRVESSREKVAEVRPAAVDYLREVEERARLAVLHGEEDTSKMVARLVKGIWLGIEEEKSELKKVKSELEKDLAQAKTEAMKEVRKLKATHAVAIGQLQVEAKANLDEIVEERDRLGCHLMLKGYSQVEVDAIKAETYVVVEDEEAEVVGVVDGLDGVSCLTVLDNQGDMCDELNERVARVKSKKDQAIARAKKAEGHVQKGNTNLREYQHKLDAALIREKVLEGEIKAKDLLVKRKEELLKDLPAKKELNADIVRLCARVVDLEAINLAESAQYIAKLKEDAIYSDKVDTKIIEWKDNCALL
ncbi:hypothetical protein GIB67_041537 [Kingdonia uniflora]|uniref:Uncharacterized protein n=1 Tax=Kingdonia uniflora TaxID=39325 RepID=A0A7J7MQB6_9MAGN|nr:hypothetical protein GIB67_041537 [Kingdonia uniflora]